MKKHLTSALVALAKAYSRLPLGFHYAVSSVLFFFAYYVVRYRRKIVHKNLVNSFPEKDEKEIAEIERKFYHHLTDFFAESTKGITISPEEVQRRFVAKNVELPQSYLAAGRSIFLYGAHIGNWEWFIALPDCFKKWAATQAFYQRQHNEFFDQVMLSLRSRGGIQPIESRRAFVSTAHKKLHGEQTITLVLGDQRPRKSGQKIWTDFLGQDTPFLAGPEYMASKLDFVLIYPHFSKPKRGHYEVEFKLICESPKDMTFGEATRRYAALLEDNIREQPEIWLWSHNKWKWQRSEIAGEDAPQVSKE